MSPAVDAGLELASPLWLLLLLALPALVVRHHRRPPAQALTYSGLPAAALPPISRRIGSWGLHLAFYCRTAALALAILAIARPQTVDRWQEETTEAADLFIALDVSGSMAAEDFQPRNRLHVAKAVVQDFITRRPGDRIGALIFADTAVTRSPLTLDHHTLVGLIESVGLDSLPDGTSIGVALATAALRLEAGTGTAPARPTPAVQADEPAGIPGKAQARVVVLVTDGANNGGEIDPLTAASLCAELGIRVYTVGVGTDERVPVPRAYVNPRTGKRQVERRMARLEVDEELLRAIAGRTGGRFFRATDREALEEIFDEIDGLERTTVVVRRHRRARDIFPTLAMAALTLTLMPLLPAVAGWSHPP